MNKKIMPLVLLGLLTVGTIAGCNKNDNPTTNTPTTGTPTTGTPSTGTPSTETPSTPTPTTPTPSTSSTSTVTVINVESVSISASSTSLYVGDTTSISVTVLPENADDKTYSLNASNDNVTIEGNVVTAAKVGTSTITVKTNDGEKTASVEITVLEAVTPDPEYKKIPFSTEENLEEKTLSYWADTDTVTLTAKDNEDGTYEINYESNDASFVDLQLLYKNSELTKDQAYLLEWNITSSVEGNITINGKTVELSKGINEISIKYVCGTDTAVATALQVYFGTATDGFIANGALSFSLPTWTETSLHTITSENWTEVSLSDPWTGNILSEEEGHWWFENEPSIVTKGAPNSWTYGLVNNTSVDANYDIKVNAQGTSDFPNQYDEHVGILAYYHDKDNYVLAYGDWDADERSHQMREFNIVSTIGGVTGGTCFNDFWGDNATYSKYAQPLSNNNEFKVEVRTVKKQLSVSLYFNENFIASKTFDISSIDSETENKAGLYVSGDDTITFSNYSYKEVEVEEQTAKYTLYNKAGNASISIDDNDNVTISNANSHKENLVLTESKLATKKYTVSTFIKSNIGYPNTEERQIGLIPWYIDENNFIIVYAQYCSWETRFETVMRELNIIGTIEGKDIVDTISWTDFWADNVTNVEPTTGFTLSVTFDNGKISPSINGNPIGYWSSDVYTYTRDLTVGFSNTDFSKEAKVGFYCNTNNENETVTFTDIKVESLVTIPVTHSYSLVESGKTPATISKNEDGTYLINSESAWENNFLVSEDINATGKFKLSTTYKATVGYPNDAERMYGLVIYWNESNFIKVYAHYVADRPQRMYEIAIMGFIGGHDADHWTNFNCFWMCEDWHLAGQGVDPDPAKGFTLGLEYDNGKFKPSVDGVSIATYHDGTNWVDTCDLASLFPSDIWAKEAKIGYFVSAGVNNPVTATDIKVEKY